MRISCNRCLLSENIKRSLPDVQAFCKKISEMCGKSPAVARLGLERAEVARVIGNCEQGSVRISVMMGSSTYWALCH